MATAAMTAAMATEDMAARSLRAPRALPLPGRRRQRVAGERIAGLFEEHGRMVYGVCRLLLRDADEAEDAAQQTFLSAYRGLLAGQEPREPAAWLGTIARNECRKRLRSRKTAASAIVTVSAGDATQREVGRRAEIEALCTALAELPEQQRDALVLREFYGLSNAEVAAALGLSGPAVESLLFRSRRRLQERLRPLRAALGVLTIPVTLRESLAQALPGFGGGGVAAGTGAGATFLVKAGSAPVAAKFAAAALALGTAGTIAGVETHAVRHRPHARVEARSAPGPPGLPATALPSALGRPTSSVPATPAPSRRGWGPGGERRDAARERPVNRGEDRSGGRDSSNTGRSDSGKGGGGSSGDGTPSHPSDTRDAAEGSRTTVSSTSGPGGGDSPDHPEVVDHSGRDGGSGSGDGSGDSGSGSGGSSNGSGGSDSGHH